MNIKRYIGIILFLLMTMCRSNEILAEVNDYKSQRLIVKTQILLPFEIAHHLGDDLFILEFASISETEEAYEQLLHTEGIEWIEPDLNLSLNVNEGISSPSEHDEYWGIDFLEIDRYRSYLIDEQKSDELLVAIIDTGLDATHSMFENKISELGYDFVNRDTEPFDDSYNSHGTHVAGIIARATAGLDNIKLLPLKVLDSRGNGTVSSLIESIRYAMDAQVDVINLSLGLYPYYHSHALESVLLEAIASGITVVIASGNDNIDTQHSCPSHLEDAIIVSAFDQTLEKAGFSNYGAQVDVSAPGVDIYSTVSGGGFGYLNGTSMAAPHISAMVALLKLNDLALTPADIEHLLKGISLDLGEVGWDSYFGFGVPILSRLLPGIAMTGLVLNQESLTLKVGETATLIASIVPSDASVSDTFIWSSSNISVASVENGSITALETGMTVIEVKLGEFIARCEVLVEGETAELKLDEPEEIMDEVEKLEEVHHIEPLPTTQEPVIVEEILPDISQSEEPKLVRAYQVEETEKRVEESIQVEESKTTEVIEETKHITKDVVDENYHEDEMTDYLSFKPWLVGLACMVITIGLFMKKAVKNE